MTYGKPSTTCSENHQFRCWHDLACGVLRLVKFGRGGLPSLHLLRYGTAVRYGNTEGEKKTHTHKTTITTCVQHSSYTLDVGGSTSQLLRSGRAPYLEEGNAPEGRPEAEPPPPAPATSRTAIRRRSSGPGSLSRSCAASRQAFDDKRAGVPGALTHAIHRIGDKSTAGGGGGGTRHTGGERHGVGKDSVQ